MSNLQDPVTEIELAELCEATKPSETMHNITRRAAFQLSAANEKLVKLEKLLQCWINYLENSDDEAVNVLLRSSKKALNR